MPCIRIFKWSGWKMLMVGLQSNQIWHDDLQRWCLCVKECAQEWEVYHALSTTLNCARNVLKRGTRSLVRFNFGHSNKIGWGALWLIHEIGFVSHLKHLVFIKITDMPSTLACFSNFLIFAFYPWNLRGTLTSRALRWRCRTAPCDAKSLLSQTLDF